MLISRIVTTFRRHVAAFLAAGPSIARADASGDYREARSAIEDLEDAVWEATAATKAPETVGPSTRRSRRRGASPGAGRS